MNKPTRLVAALSLIMAGTAQGMDLIEAYELALTNDPQIRVAKQVLEVTLEKKPQAKSALLPFIALEANADRLHTDTKNNPSAIRNGTDNFSQSGLSIGLTQPLYDRGAWEALKQADYTIAAAEAEYANAKLDLMRRVVEAYFEVLASEDALTVSKGQVEANRRQLDQAKQRFEVGLIAITDVHEAQAAFDGARADEISDANEVDNAWEALTTIIGYYREPLSILGEELKLNPPVPADIEEWAATALNQNYSVIAAESTAEEKKTNIEIQRSGHFPTLDLVAGYDTNNNSSRFGSDVDSGRIGLQLDVPIYQGGFVNSRMRQAQADYQGSLESLDQSRRKVNQDVRNAYRAVLTDIQSVGARKATVVSSTSALESTQAGYEVGTRTLVDVLTVQTNLFDATRNYLGSRYQYIISGLELKFAASSLSREDLERVNTWLDTPKGGSAKSVVRKNLKAQSAGSGRKP
ncbi:MAG: TolC family outer membrane protein [Gammaproteobacteria bacterium]|nr:TolC family outer membrane protein [Gammaproteobacteria bacterium]